MSVDIGQTLNTIFNFDISMNVLTKFRIFPIHKPTTDLIYSFV